MENLEKKLEYLGLNLSRIPKIFKQFEPLEFRIPKFYDEKQYKQYRFLPVKDIQILLSPTTRLDELEEKYKKASPLFEYLDSKSEENIPKHATFLKMLDQIRIEDIEKVETEQENLNREIPFKVKFEGNYLWQIYYSENTDKYFMLVPTEDSDYSTFFYLLKKQLEKKKTDKIFVPIRNVAYSTNYLKKSEFEDVVNYLWLFTKDWPLVYEVFDKENELSIQIVGETEVYEKIKSPYKIVLNNQLEARRFYKLLKALFILQTELPHYFNFRTNIDKKGKIQFLSDNKIVELSNMPEWINYQYRRGLKRKKQVEELIETDTYKLNNLKEEAALQEIEYLAKEKQISTFLECKKSFFGKFKYYFKYNKKKNKNKMRDNDDTVVRKKVDKKEKRPVKKEEKIRIKKNYTIEELIEFYKEYEKQEETLKNLVMDINALKLKNKNMKKKIENAIMYIEEIDSHKKSIFEFWKYSNKDEVAALAEGEEEEVNIIKTISKIFDYEEDFEEFGKTMDKLQRKKLTKEETDSIYLTTTDVLGILNKVKLNEATPKEIQASLIDLKKQAREEKVLLENDEFDIFGGIAQDSTKISKIANKRHREVPKDKFNILEINKNTNPIGYKLSLEQVTENIKKALRKVVVSEDLPVYMATTDEGLNKKKINVFNINPEKEIQEFLKRNDSEEINFFKVNLKRGTNAISCTNCIFYDNQNKTLPIGQELSSKIIVDTTKIELNLKEKTAFKIVKFENKEDDFSDIEIKNINVLEYDIE